MNVVRREEALSLPATGYEFSHRVAALIGLQDKDEKEV